MGWRPEAEGKWMTETWALGIEREGRAWCVAAVTPLKN